jgi:oligosaccharide translocation protein RFT1
MANTRQSVIKHVLTEGDRIVVGKISPLGDQGGYAIAINYGSSLLNVLRQFSG